MAPNKPLKLPLAAAEVDRSAHLRSDATYLDSAWPDAAVLLFCDEKFASPVQTFGDVTWVLLALKTSE